MQTSRETVGLTPARSAVPLIVITGASGFVGMQLVPRLALQGDILLVSRDPRALRDRLPG